MVGSEPEANVDVALAVRLAANRGVRMASITNIHRDGQPFTMGNTESRVLVSPRTGARHVTFNYIRYAPGAEFPQHLHDHSEDVFLVLTGSLTIRMDEGDVTLGPGQLYVVPRGIAHQPVATEGAEVLLIEPSSTVNTGDNPGELTAERQVV